MEILFSWKNEIHLVVLSLCHFFLLDEQHTLPLFKASLRIRYAMHYNKYVFCLIYEMQDSDYGALAVFLADWLALHFPLSGMCHERLPLINFTQDYGTSCHHTHHCRCLYLRDHGILRPVKFLYNFYFYSASAYFPSYLLNPYFVVAGHLLKWGK